MLSAIMSNLRITSKSVCCIVYMSNDEKVHGMKEGVLFNLPRIGNPNVGVDAQGKIDLRIYSANLHGFFFIICPLYS